MTPGITIQCYCYKLLFFLLCLSMLYPITGHRRRVNARGRISARHKIGYSHFGHASSNIIASA